MLFYDSANPAPNPRRVRIFLAEKGLRVPTAHVSIPAGEHRGEAYLKVNPLGQTPSLALDDGSVLTESISICRYGACRMRSLRVARVSACSRYFRICARRNAPRRAR